MGYHINDNARVQLNPKILSIDTDLKDGQALAAHITTSDDSLRIEEIRLQESTGTAKLLVRSLEPINSANLKNKLTYICDRYFTPPVKK